jgi:hypothetical protein
VTRQTATRSNIGDALLEIALVATAGICSGTSIWTDSGGARIEANPTKQQRCGSHPERPFLVVGKFGQGRRYRCPFKGCDSVGAILAQSVLDLDLKEAPVDSVAALKGDAKKEADELSVFQEFTKAAALSAEAPDNAKPPHPDIRCKLDGKDYWFELGRITDTNLAKEISGGWKNRPKPFSILQEEPFERIMRQKAKKTYHTDGRPVDLVLHFDQQPPDRAVIGGHLQSHADMLSDLTRTGPFSRVWIYDGWSKTVLWRSGD